MTDNFFASKVNILWLVLTLLTFFCMLYVGYSKSAVMPVTYPVPWLVKRYAFVIWPVIYLTQVVLVGLMAATPQTTTINWIFFNIISVQNMFWVLVYTSDVKGKLFAAVPLLFSLVAFLYCSWTSFWRENTDRSFIYYLSANIVAFYLGWCTVASAINLTQLFHFEMKLSQKLSKIFAPTAVILLSGLFSFFAFTYQKFGTGFFGFYVSVGWGLFCVAMALIGSRNSQTAPLLVQAS